MQLQHSTRNCRNEAPCDPIQSIKSAGASTDSHISMVSSVQQQHQPTVACQHWQHREQQMQQLRLLLNRQYVPDILVYGPSCTGKSTIVREMVSSRPHAYISCSKSLKLRQLLSSTVAQLTLGGKRKRNHAFAGAAGTENSLIWELQAVCPADQQSRVLVLDDMQQFLAAADGPLAPLLALREQAGANLSLVLVSRAQPAALGLLDLLPGILHVSFPAYTDTQLVDILAAAGPPAAASSLQQQQQGLYRTFLQDVVVQSFKSLSRCLPDLACQAAALWPRYVAAAGTAPQQPGSEDEEDVEVTQASLGHAAVRGMVQAALEAFQPAACCAVASAAGVRQQPRQQQQQWQVMGVSGAAMAASTELCRMSKLLIIAAFLASRNKPSVDKQLFDDGTGFTRRRGGRRRNVMGANRQAEAAKTAELKGPHTFSLARLMAVYANLLEADENHAAAGSSSSSILASLRQQQGGVSGSAAAMGGGWVGVQSADVLMGVKSLVAARLLTQACDDLLDAPRFGCEAPQELVEQLAVDMGIPLTSYLKFV